MKNNLAKNIARRVMLRHRLWRSPSCEELKSIIESKGFVLIMYKRCNNTKDIEDLVERLRVQKEVAERDSFIYINNSLRIVFLNSDMGEEEKCALLRHELGHILDPDLIAYGAYSSGVKREEFANEFSYHLKSPGVGFRLCAFINQKRVLFGCAVGALLCASILFFTVYGNLKLEQEHSVPGVKALQEDRYYVTSGGEKYHRGYCVIVKNRTNVTEVSIDDAMKKGYGSCDLCIGE